LEPQKAPSENVDISEKEAHATSREPFAGKPPRSLPPIESPFVPRLHDEVSLATMSCVGDIEGEEE
jgi:hypothetical protein